MSRCAFLFIRLFGLVVDCPWDEVYPGAHIGNASSWTEGRRKKTGMMDPPEIHCANQRSIVADTCVVQCIVRVAAVSP